MKFDIPEGVEVQGATNFSGGVLGDLVYDGTTGNGPTITWHGESEAEGECSSPVKLQLPRQRDDQRNATFDVFVVYSVRGDSIGADPHATLRRAEDRKFRDYKRMAQCLCHLPANLLT